MRFSGSSPALRAARSCARAYDLPVTIARMNASYGTNGGLLTYHLDWLLAGRDIVAASGLE